MPEIDKDLPESEKRMLRARYAGELRAKVNVAKTICNRCTFVEPCLEYALRNDVLGIWGASTEKERCQIRKTRGIPTPRSITLISNSWAMKKGAR